MKTFNRVIALIAISPILAGCGAIPTAVERTAATSPDVAGNTGDVQVTAGESGLGTIAYDEKTRAKSCGTMRRTGSHRYMSKCDDPDGGSQPVRYGTFNDLGRLAMSGSVRPENY